MKRLVKTDKTAPILKLSLIALSKQLVKNQATLKHIGVETLSVSLSLRSLLMLHHAVCHLMNRAQRANVFVAVRKLISLYTGARHINLI
jgi:hypothetical protein